MKIKFLLASLIFLLSACEKSDDADKIGSAQACLDKVKNNYSAADACIEGIMELESPQANILKCSGLLLGGGLTTDRVKEAILKMRDESLANKELVFMGYLAISDVSRAETAAEYCEDSNSRGMIYISSAVHLGSIMSAELPGGFTTTPDPAALAAVLASDPDIPDSVVGQIGSNLATNYCTEATKDTDICKEMMPALEAGTSTSDIGNRIRQLLTDGN